MAYEQIIRSIRDSDHYSSLVDVICSPVCSTEQEGEYAHGEEELIILGREDIETIVRSHVSDIDSMRCRRNVTPVLTFIQDSYTSGIPLFNDNDEMNRHIIHCMQSILAKVIDLQPADARKHLRRLCEGFQACQSVQARVIDSVYGQITGREKGLKDQFLYVIDEIKQTTLDLAVATVFPRAREDDPDPGNQMPHIQSAVKIAIGEELGLRGVIAARSDYCAPTISDANLNRIKELFKEEFDIMTVISAIIADVNQQDDQMERVVDRDCLANWVFEKGEAFSLNPYDIYFNEERKAWYNDAEPKEENIYNPFVHPRIVFDILVAMFLNIPAEPLPDIQGGEEEGEEGKA